MRTRPFLHGLVVAALSVALHSQAIAQQQSVATPAPQQTAEQLAKEAHRLASSAKNLDDFTQALRVCGQVMKANPTPEQSAYVNSLAGWTYNKRGEVLVKLAEDTAESDAQRAAEYEQAAIKDFGLAMRFNQDDWKPRFNRAVSVAVLGDFKTALTDLDFVISKQPAHKNAHFNRGEILLQMGEYERAAADYSTVIEQDVNDSAAYAGRGIALSALGDSEKALMDLNTVVRLEPENATAYVDRADLYAAMGDWERAAGDYRVAIGLDNSMARAYQNVAWLMATCPEKRFRNPDLAVRAAKKAIELEGQTYLGLDTYAAALASTGEFQKAQAVQQQAIAKAPKDEQSDLTQRLSMYRDERQFIERAAESGKIQLATAEEDVVK